MSKSARRLWFGDWQRDDERDHALVSRDEEDTVVITPVDDDDAPLQSTPRRRMQPRTAILLGIAALCAFGFGLASGGGDSKTQTAARSADPQSQTPQAQAPQQLPQVQVPQAQGVPPQGFGGADLTGPEAEKAARAALSQYPGQIERVTRDPSGGGGYVVHVIQETGEVHVVVGGDFRVEGSDAGSGAPQNFAPGTPGRSQ